MEISLKEIARFVDGTVEGNDNILVSGIAEIEKAKEGDITFIANPKYVKFLDSTQASVVVCSPDLSSKTKTLLKVKNPYLAYARIIRFGHPPMCESGTVDERAVIGKDVRIGRNVTIYPYVFVGDGCVIDEGVTIYPNCFIGTNVSIGKDTFVHPNVTIREGCVLGSRVIIHSGTVIGSDGFGFAKDGPRYYKIPQLGIVQIDDDVEIGANCTIDRATMGKTWIQRGVKIDNLVQVAHNVVVGENSIIIAQVGISGSTKLGKNVILAGQVGIIGHVELGDNVRVGAQSGVGKSIPAGQIVSGSPAIAHRDWLKNCQILNRLPELRKKIMKMEKRLAELEQEKDS